MNRITAGFEPSLAAESASPMLFRAVRGLGPILEAKLAGSDSNRVLQLFQQKPTVLPLYVVVIPGLMGSPFTGHSSLTGFPWKAQAIPAARKTAAAMLKDFILAPPAASDPRSIYSTPTALT
jgi:hypothetical protein